MSPHWLLACGKGLLGEKEPRAGFWRQSCEQEARACLQSRGSLGAASWAIHFQGVHRCQSQSGTAGDRAAGQDGRGLSPHDWPALTAGSCTLPARGWARVTFPRRAVWSLGAHWPQWCRSRKFPEHEHGKDFRSGATHPFCFSFSPHTPKHNSHM